MTWRGNLWTRGHCTRLHKCHVKGRSCTVKIRTTLLSRVSNPPLVLVYFVWLWMWALKSWGWFNIKMPSYEYKNSHYKNKTVSRPSHLYNRDPYNGKRAFYIELSQCLHILLLVVQACHQVHYKNCLHCWYVVVFWGYGLILVEFCLILKGYFSKCVSSLLCQQNKPGGN